MSEHDPIMERLDKLEAKLLKLLHRCIEAKAKHLAKKHLTKGKDNEQRPTRDCS